MCVQRLRGDGAGAAAADDAARTGGAIATAPTSRSRWPSTSTSITCPWSARCGSCGARGWRIDSQTLWDQLEAVATVLAADLRGPAPVRADGAGDRRGRDVVARAAGARPASAGGPGVVTREDAVTYTILESRSQEAARQVLNGYRGIVIADGYGAYEALARAGPRFTLAHCWAHVRRKFVEAEPHYPGPCAEVLDCQRSPNNPHLWSLKFPHPS